MKSRIILTASAVFLFGLGIVFDFLPQETAAVLGLPALPLVSLLVQLLAGPLLAMGLLNWFNKTRPMGGIYARPLALANFLLFLVSAVPLLRISVHGAVPLLVKVAAAVFAAFALAFVWLLFFHDPLAGQEAKADAAQ